MTGKVQRRITLMLAVVVWVLMVHGFGWPWWLSYLGAFVLGLSSSYWDDAKGRP